MQQLKTANATSGHHLLKQLLLISRATSAIGLVYIPCGVTDMQNAWHAHVMCFSRLLEHSNTGEGGSIALI